MSKILINVAAQPDGWVFELQPLSLHEVRKEYPSVSPVPRVSMGFDTRSDFETIVGPVWNQVLMLLTGLSIDQVMTLGGAEFISVKDDHVMHTVEPE